MEDGSKVVGLFNRGSEDLPLAVQWTELGIKGKWQARDLWRQQELGKFEGQFPASIPRHGVVLVKLHR